MVIEAGDHHWRASAEGNGAVDALFKAVDAALADVLQGHPRLVGYDVHALAEGPEAEGLVIVAIEPPAGEGARSQGLYNGKARSTNIIAASIEAYLEALNAMLAEAHWAGAAETAGKGRRRAAEPHGRRGGARSKDAEATSRPLGSTSRLATALDAATWPVALRGRAGGVRRGRGRRGIRPGRGAPGGRRVPRGLRGGCPRRRRVGRRAHREPRQRLGPRGLRPAPRARARDHRRGRRAGRPVPRGAARARPSTTSSASTRTSRRWARRSGSCARGAGTC